MIYKSARELGLRQTFNYLGYRLRMRSGLLHRRAVAGQLENANWLAEASELDLALRPLLEVPDPARLASYLSQQDQDGLTAEADEIVSGQVRLFGGPLKPLELAPTGPREHWIEIERRGLETGSEGEDIKWTWEPARFEWAYTLGRAYLLSGDERYPQAFWTYTEQFLQANPPQLGLNWASAQEVAIRIFAFVFAHQIFENSEHSTPERCRRLAQAVSEHAARIPPSLAYARAQDNNHLLSEAAGLYTAALALPAHPRSEDWRTAGWNMFHGGLATQIAANGAYVQNSTNYHRLMLQLALWMHKISPQPFPESSQELLSAATRWLLALLDRRTGRTPNLGPNDGAYLFPLTAQPFGDYRPVVQAAARTFLGGPVFPGGPWEEMSLWFRPRPGATSSPGDAPMEEEAAPDEAEPEAAEALELDQPGGVEAGPHILRASDPSAWAYLRVAHFDHRPGHADQLHLDLWWRGLNLAHDPGTYLYNAPPPWDNALAHTAAHNSVTVEGHDQMTRAGRFLWLDWADAWLVQKERAENDAWRSLTARHNGYRRFGLDHERSVTWSGTGLRVIDRLIPVDQDRLQRGSLLASLHWQLPDWAWTLEAGEPLSLELASPHGPVGIRIAAATPETTSRRVLLVRAGEVVHGEGPVPESWGWYAPTYGFKEPALSLIVSLEGAASFLFETRWSLPG